MGTRADFYVGRGVDARWCGSIAWDGYPEGIDIDVLMATTVETYEAALMRFFAGRDDVSGPDQGWPWPWDDSRATDYSYALDEGCVWVTCFGYGWDKWDEDEDEDERPKVDFPDMSSRRLNGSAVAERSGLFIIHSKRPS